MAVKADIVPAVEAHAAHIATHMRQADRDELAALGLTPLAAILLSLKTATAAWTGTINGEPVCIFGVCPTSALTPQVGRPFLMTTDKVERYSLLFLRRCRPVVGKMLQIFPILENWIASSNKIAIMWLTWLGFHTVGGSHIEFGRTGFVKFKMENAVNEPTAACQFKPAIAETEQFLKGLEQLHVQPVHRFASGLYCRELTMPKDTVWVSRVHLHENFAFIMTGSCIVVSDAGSQRIDAPFAMKTSAGTKRLIRILEDSTWVTVHAIPEELGQDMEKIEKYLVVDTLEEYDQLLLEERRKLLCE